MKRVALYLRVSTLDQHPETQLHDLRAMAAQRNLEVVREYVDHGISGTRVRRPGLDEMMRDARRGQFDGVLVWAFDRRPAGPGDDHNPRRDQRAGAKPDRGKGPRRHAPRPAGGPAPRPASRHCRS